MPFLPRTALLCLVSTALAPAAPSLQESVHLAWRGSTGQEVRYRATMHQTTSIARSGETEVVSDFVFRMRVAGVDDGGVGDVRVDYEAVRLHGPGLEYDSTREDAGTQSAALEAIFRPMIDTDLHLALEPTGRVRSFTGLAELREKIRSSQGALPPTLIDDLLGDDSLRRMVELGVFPDRAIVPGDTWKRDLETRLTGTGNLRVALENTFRGRAQRSGRDCAHVEVTGSVELDLSDTPPIPTRLQDGRISGTSFFDLAEGWLVESAIDSTLELEMDFAGSSTPLTIHSTQSLRRIPLDAPPFD